MFKKQGFVNINNIERNINKENNRYNNCYIDEYNIGIQIDSNFVFPAMITLASIMDSQNPKTKIRFHIAVVLNFTIEQMLKIYSLKNKIREDIEFKYKRSWGSSKTSFTSIITK